MARRLMITLAVGATVAAVVAGSALAVAPSSKTYIYKNCDQFTRICSPQITNPQH